MFRFQGSICKKMLAVLGLGLAVVLVSALYGVSAAFEGLDEIARVNRTSAVQARMITDALEQFREGVQQGRNAFLLSSHPEELGRYRSGFEDKERAVASAARRVQKVTRSPEVKELLGRFLAAQQEMGRKYRVAFDAFKNGGFDPKAGAGAVNGSDGPPAALLAQAVKLLRGSAASRMSAVQAEIRNRLTIALVAMGLLMLATLLACFRLLLRAVIAPIVEATRAAETVAQGDLSSPFKTDSKDELGHLFAALERMRGGLAESMRAILLLANGMRNGSIEIARGSADLSSRTEEQSSSLEAAASSMHELSGAVKSNSEDAQQAKRLADEANERLGASAEVTSMMIGAMDEISASSRKISDILETMDTIAVQTNLLAINAAVEAARAGEQGRGFAVVAGQVRALAQRAGTAAKEIRELIESSNAAVAVGEDLVIKTGESLSEIRGAISKVNAIVAGISASSGEQRNGIAQVSRAIEQMEQVVRQSAALVARSVAEIRKLAGQSDALSNAVGRFRVRERPAPIAPSVGRLQLPPSPSA